MRQWNARERNVLGYVRSRWVPKPVLRDALLWRREAKPTQWPMKHSPACLTDCDIATECAIFSRRKGIKTELPTGMPLYTKGTAAYAGGPSGNSGPWASSKRTWFAMRNSRTHAHMSPNTSRKKPTGGSGLAVATASYEARSRARERESKSPVGPRAAPRRRRRGQPVKVTP